jgi:hypothetical protein
MRCDTLLLSLLIVGRCLESGREMLDTYTCAQCEDEAESSALEPWLSHTEKVGCAFPRI